MRAGHACLAYTEVNMRRKLKLILGPVIVLATLVAFGWYLHKHPAIVDQLQQTPPLLILGLFICFAGVQVALIGVLTASLMLFQKHMGIQENFLLNAYSSLVNFFGPGQSGPGFRAAYLKVRHEVKIKQYLFATLLYYVFYAIYSGLLLSVASRAWWQTVLLTIAISGVCYGFISYFMSRNRGILPQRMPRSTFAQILLVMGAATLLQMLCTFAFYYLELHSLDSTITLKQVLAYTGAANFALFVSITPGAIGIREAFLLFSQSLHNIPSDIIIAANVLDRAAYVAFLGVLFIVVLVMHVGAKLQPKNIRATVTKE
jgi:uncharacterized membrane protein YbhN (UPF0104 family)